MFHFRVAANMQIEPAGTSLRSRLESIVYPMAINDVAKLQQRAEDGCEFILNTAGISEQV